MSKTPGKSAIDRIYGHGRGWAFSQKDFQDLGRVDMALKRLADEGTIRRVIRGIYDYPRYSELLKQQIAPDIHQVAQALARKFGWRIQADGASAMNLIGLSTQVPSQFTFTSDGPNRTYEVGKSKLSFTKTSLKESGFKYPESSLIVQAIKALGEERIGREEIQILRKWLPAEMRKRVLKDTDRTTSWVFDAIRKVCKED